MEIVVDQYGQSLGKKSERVVVKEKGKIVFEKPFFEVDAIVVASRGGSLSSDLVAQCVEHGIPISFIKRNGETIGMVTSPTQNATIKTRRAQLRAYDNEIGVNISRKIVYGKLRNQISVLNYFGKSRKGKAVASINEAAQSISECITMLSTIKGPKIDDVRLQLINIEARAAKAYWKAVKEILAPYVGFPGRKHKGAKDPVNTMLNYGYGILYYRAARAIVSAGLDQYGGFIHVDRPGKFSMVLDFVEEFRQQAVDRVVFSALTKGYRPSLEEDGLLSLNSRREIAERVRARLEDSRENYRGKKYALGTIMKMQARQLAACLRSGREYKPFIGGW